MGIQGLLPFLQKCSRKVDISEFSGCTVAIDVYCWLHKGAFSCAEKLARGEDTDQYVNFCMKYVTMLLSHNIRPILVFDGCHLPAKAETEKFRRERRESTRRRAGELLREEKVEEAKQLMRRCVDITHTMAHRLIRRARTAGVDCIVAPYEADAQLAYLNMAGIAHFVITEDSDLLLFGCTKVVFKLDVGGMGLLVEQEMLPIAMKMRPEEFTLDKFRQMCVLSGCDYLPSLPGIGLTKACKFVKLTSQTDISKIIHKIGSYLNMPNMTVPEEYKSNFLSALSMFQHQPVFDPLTRSVVPLTPVPEGTEVGSLPTPHPPDVALQLALGNIDPISMKVVDDWDPVTHLKEGVKNHKRSIWSPEYRKPVSLPPPQRSKIQPPVSTFGKQLAVTTDSFPRLTNSAKKTTGLEEENSSSYFATQKSMRSEEEELEEMRGAWGVAAKRLRLDRLEQEYKELDVSIDDLIGPSPPRSNPFRTTPSSTPASVQRHPTTTLSRLTSPPSSVEAPLTQSRYFASSASPSVTETLGASSSSEKFDGPGILDKIIKSDVVPESPKRPSQSPAKTPRRNISVVSTSVFPESSLEKSAVKKNKISRGRSLLSAMEQEDEDIYRSVEEAPSVSTPRPSLANFKWKSLANDKSAESKLVISDKVTKSQRGNRGRVTTPKRIASRSTTTKPLMSDKTTLNDTSDELPPSLPAIADLLLDTPPNSQEQEDTTAMTIPKLPAYLEPARSVGLSKKNQSSKQTLLAKFGFQPKEKMKI